MMGNKLPIQIEVYSTPGLGKTHFCFKGVPSPTVIDLSPTKESYANAVMYGMTDQYSSVMDMAPAYNSNFDIDSLRSLVKDIILGGHIKTVCFDSSKYLQDIASATWIKEENKRRKIDDKKPLNSVYPIGRYGDVRKKVDDLFAYILGCGVNIVCTSQLKSEYNGNKKTSKLIPHGYPKLDYQSHVRIRIGVVADKVVYSIRKNRFVYIMSDKYFKRIDELSMNCLVDNICRATDMDKDVFVL